MVAAGPDRRAAGRGDLLADDLLETRLLGGVPYLLIRADDGVEVNGVSIQMPE